MYCSVLLGTCSYMCATTFGLPKYGEASYQNTVRPVGKIRWNLLPKYGEDSYQNTVKPVTKIRWGLLPKYGEACYQNTVRPLTKGHFFSALLLPCTKIYIFLRQRPKLKCCRLETQNVVRFRDLETSLACLVSVIYIVDDHLCVRISCEIVHDPLQLSTRIIAPDHGTPPETRVFLLCLPCASISLWVQGRLAPRRSNNFDFSIFRVISA